MKKIHYFLLMIIASSISVTSCSKDQNSNPVDQSPNIDFIADTGYISSNATLLVNQAFKVGIIASSNAISGANLVKFSITRIFNDIPFIQDTALNTNQVNFKIHATASGQAGQEQWLFKVTDMDNQTKQIGFTITTETIKANKPGKK